jgi:hypothetical protein
MEKKSNIEWDKMTVDEINVKLLNIKFTYESISKMSFDLLEKLELLENEHDKGMEELNRRKI